MKTLITHLRRLHQCRSGAAAVEFAIIGLVLITLLVGIVQVGHALQIRNDLARAADIGLRAALIDPKISDATLSSIIQAPLTGYNSSLLVVSTSENVVVGETKFRVLVVKYPYKLLIPGVNADPITLQASRKVPVV